MNHAPHKPKNRSVPRSQMSLFSVGSLRRLVRALDRLVRGAPPPPTSRDVGQALANLRSATPEQLEESRQAVRRLFERERQARDESAPPQEPPAGES